MAATVRADIFQWEYINPADLSQGIQESTTLCPDGAGVDAIPSAVLTGKNLTKAFLSDKGLTNINLGRATLSNAVFTRSNLTNATLLGATLIDADLSYTNLRDARLGALMNNGQANLAGANMTGADVRGSDLIRLTTTGLTASQLYSTASYQTQDLTGINLSVNNLNGWSFVGQNLTDAGFASTTLNNVDFTGAQIRGAGFNGSSLTLAQLASTASYQAGDLAGVLLTNVNLSGASFAGMNLENANLSAVLDGADFSNAAIRGAQFATNTFTAEQLYSTATYQSRDLTGIGLGGTFVDRTGWNFVGQNLTNASFTYANLTDADFTNATVRETSFVETVFTATQLYSTASYKTGDLRGIRLGDNNLSGWNFAGQNLTDASFGAFGSSNLFNTDFSAADTRGADRTPIGGSILVNTITDNGRIQGLDLTASKSLAIRDYDGDSSPFRNGPLPIFVTMQMAMDSTGELQLLFEEDAWDSLISFEAGISVALGGTLKLNFASGVDLRTQIGRTIRVFNWTGVSPAGQFQVESPYSWDLSRLYTTGEVTLVPEPSAMVLTIFGVLCSLSAVRRDRSGKNFNRAELCRDR